MLDGRRIWLTWRGCARCGASRAHPSQAFVYSTTLGSADWQNTTVLSGDFADDVAKVKDDVDGIILVADSAALVQGLIANDLLDELRLMVFPVTLGGGKVPLTLSDARTIGAGIQLLTYERP